MKPRTSIDVHQLPGANARHGSCCGLSLTSAARAIGGLLQVKIFLRRGATRYGDGRLAGIAPRFSPRSTFSVARLTVSVDRRDLENAKTDPRAASSEQIQKNEHCHTTINKTLSAKLIDKAA